MDKGQRVRITGGRQGKDQTGTIFWKGPNKYGSGDRYGVRADDGETYWVSGDNVEATDAAAPPIDAGPTFAKGDRVAYKVRGEEGIGSVFWIGESRSGPGQRLGVRPDGSDDAVWLDSRQARAATEEDEQAAAARSLEAEPTWDTGSRKAPNFGEDVTPEEYAPSWARAICLPRRPSTTRSRISGSNRKRTRNRRPRTGRCRTRRPAGCSRP